MSHEAPQLTAPAPEQIQQNLGQEQLFNDAAYDEQAIAERQAQAEATLDAIVATTPDERIRLTKPVSEEEAQTARDALALLKAPNEELPGAVKIKRDYADNMAEHTEKQEAKKTEVAAVLEARLASHEESAAIKAVNAADNQKIADKLSLEVSREAKTAALKEARSADVAKRQELREAYIAKQRLLRGENQSKLFADEISRDADKHVKSVMHPGSELRADSGVVDTQKLKDEKYGKLAPNVVKNQETSEALKDFHKGFPDKQAAKAETSSEPEIAKEAPKAESKEAMEDTPAVRYVSYRPDAEGNVVTAIESLGSTETDLADHKNNCVLINTAAAGNFPANTYYVEYGSVFNLGRMEETNNDEGGWDISEMGHRISVRMKEEGVLQVSKGGNKTSVRLGDKLWVNGKQVSGPISGVLVEVGEAKADELDESWELRDEVSPFIAAEALIDSIVDGTDGSTELIAPEIKDQEYVLMSERPKQIMGWAKRQLSRLKNAPLAVGTYVSNKIHNTSERFNNLEKGKRRTIIGATAGALALGLAGVILERASPGASQHLQLVTGPKGGIPSPLDGFNPGSANNKHQVATTIAEYIPKSTDKVEHTVTLRHGLTPSHIALDQLQQENLPTDQAHILARTQHILDLNNWSWEQARHLADNTEVKV